MEARLNSHFLRSNGSMVSGKIVFWMHHKSPERKDDAESKLNFQTAVIKLKAISLLYLLSAF
jgi:hypothetical protein